MKKIILKLSWFERVWLAWIFLIGLFLTLLVPPLQKPDEYIHFQRAISMSNGFIICPSTAAQWKIQNTYSDVFTLVDSYSLTQNPAGKFYYKEFLQPLFRDEQGKITTEASAYALCGLPPLGYVPQTIGLIFSNIFQLNGFYGFYLGRLFGFLAFFAVLVASVKYSHEKFRPLFLIFASLPMVLHQVGTYSYDSAQFTFGLLLFLLLFKLIEQQKINWKLLLSFITMLFIFYLTKYQSFWPFFALPLLVVDKVLQHKEKMKAVALIGIYGIVVLFTFVTAQLNIFSVQKAIPETSELTPQAIQRSIIAADPLRIFDVMVETTKVQGWFYFNSFFGNFGWLDYELNLGIYLIIFALIIYGISRFSLPTKDTFPFLKAMLCLVIMVLSYFLIVFGMFLFWTPQYDEIGGLVSHGSQGRYFILLVPVAFLFVGYLKQAKWGKAWFFGVLGVFAAYRIIMAVFLRYYDYHSNYDFVTEHQVIDESAVTSTLGSAVELNMEVLPNRKFKGFTLGPVAIAEKKGFRMPYVYELRSGGCGTSGELLVQDYVLNRDYRSAQLDVVFRTRAISTVEQTQYCVTFKPYVDQSEQTKTFQYLGRSEQLQIEPAYLR